MSHDALNKQYAKLSTFLNNYWQQQVLPSFCDFLRIPNQSVAFDEQWRENGHMHRAITCIKDFCAQQKIPGLKCKVYDDEQRTPLLLIDIPASTNHNGQQHALIYGHLDKQPPNSGWRTGLGPWDPVLEGERLYARGSGDDGYCVYTAISALAMLAQHNIAYPRTLIMLETGEESGSPDMPYYLQHLQNELQHIGVLLVLDSGCGSYDKLWITSSLRGMCSGDLHVGVLNNGIHSGSASGVVPSSFRILRELLARIECSESGKLLLPELNSSIPDSAQQHAQKLAEIVGDDFLHHFPC